MPTRLFEAVLSTASAHGPPEAPWLALTFRLLGSRAPVDEVHDRLDLGPELTLESASSMARLLRLLRVARVATPRDARALLGQPEEALRRTLRAVGVPLLLEVRPRSTLRLRIWTEEGVEEIDSVAEVVESKDAFVVRRLTGELPIRIPRERVVRHESRRERWYEVTGIERPEPKGR
ncbi:MAG: hypothetical protein QNK05_02265 [Myxococcota bacterium]|nr:hypothetical protein [Myxococcota bacterium]